MPDIAQIISGGLANPWLYLPAAMLLGALHALEPGHSKSLMAGFIIAIRGTAWQAALLGLSAAIGHTLVVWLLVLVALWIGSEHIEEKAYPWLVLVSGLMILAIALRLFWSLWSRAGHGQDHQHAQDHDHDHAHHPHDASCGHSHESPAALQARFAGRPVRNWEVAWFGLTGGLLPCPSAIAVRRGHGWRFQHRACRHTRCGWPGSSLGCEKGQRDIPLRTLGGGPAAPLRDPHRPDGAWRDLACADAVAAVTVQRGRAATNALKASPRFSKLAN
jgi:hypothetical protein